VPWGKRHCLREKEGSLPLKIKEKAKDKYVEAIEVTPIEGAFGVKLGQKWEGNKGSVTVFSSCNFPRYWNHRKEEKDIFFLPKTKNDNFREYYVYITPYSHIVYKIQANDCERNQPRDSLTDKCLRIAIIKEERCLNY